MQEVGAAPSVVIEDKVLALLAHDRLFGCAVVPYLDEDLFVKPRSKLFLQIIKYFYDKFSAPPTFESCVNEAKKRRDELDVEVYRSLGEFVYTVYASGLSDDAGYIKQEISSFIQVAALRSAISKSGVYVEQGKVTEIHHEFEKARLAGAIFNAPPLELVASVEDRIVKRERHETKQKIPTGFGLLDADLRGGLAKTELGVIFGGYNIGKSMLMQQFMVNAASQGKRCLYITLEMSELEVANRLEANITGIPMDELITRASDIKNARDTLMKRYEGLLYIQEFPSGTLDINTIPAIIHQFNLMYGQLDVIFLDYADILKTNARGDLRLDLKDIYIRFRAIANENNVAAWTVSQVNRQGLDANTVRGKHANECIDKLFIADIVISINQQESEYPSRGRVWIEKARRSRKWQERVVRCNFPIARIEMRDEDQMQLTPEAHVDIQDAVQILSEQFRGNGDENVS